MNKLVHWEIPSTDLQKSTKFYSALFGWKFQGWSETYALFSVEGGVGGGIAKVENMPTSGIDVYVGVEDIPALLAKAESLGGKTDQPKTEIGGGMGFFAFFRDPCGCRIGVASEK